MAGSARRWPLAYAWRGAPSSLSPRRRRVEYLQERGSRGARCPAAADMNDALSQPTHPPPPGGAAMAAFRELRVWLGIASIVLNLIAAGLFGLIELNDRAGWHSCVIDTCEGNHIGSPVFLGLVMTAGPAVFMAVLAGLLAVMTIAAVSAARRWPSREELLTTAVLTLGFAVEVAIAAYAGDRSVVDAASGLVVATVTTAIYLSVQSFASLVAVGYGAAQIARTRRVTRWPALALGWGLGTIGIATWWWFFTDRSL